MIIDITKEIFTCDVFPGDPAPAKKTIRSMERGDKCNLTEFSMCAHNGTHVDAPLHFIKDGKALDEVGIEPFVGDCFVARHEGFVYAADAERIVEKAKAAGASERILIAGKATLLPESAKVFAAAKLKLYGNESQTVGPEDDTTETHQILLGSGMVLLEGAVLKNVEEGKYFLSAAPIYLGGCEGAPCRAYLIK